MHAGSEESLEGVQGLGLGGSAASAGTNDNINKHNHIISINKYQ